MAQVPNTPLDADIVGAITDCCSYNGELLNLVMFLISGGEGLVRGLS